MVKIQGIQKNYYLTETFFLLNNYKSDFVLFVCSCRFYSFNPFPPIFRLLGRMIEQIVQYSAGYRCLQKVCKKIISSVIWLTCDKVGSNLFPDFYYLAVTEIWLLWTFDEQYLFLFIELSFNMFICNLYSFGKKRRYVMVYSVSCTWEIYSTWWDWRILMKKGSSK